MTQPPVDPDQRPAVDDLFDGAVELPADQRAAWLDANCSDAGVRSEVEELLRAYEETHEVLDRKAFDLARPLLDKRQREQIGPYRLLREIGRGGMGVVSLAERVDGQYRQRVAIKLLRSSPDTDELHRRFVAERQILASLNHPNIAQLLDGGRTDDHLPFLVMEFVDGVPITTYCDRQHLTVEERLLLFRDVCSAVHHAHQNLVIHRDIKPSNILVTADRRVKLLDFGIAKLLNPMLGPADQPMTRTEWRVMTPEYASPEQVRGDSLTTASDVYALGVLLYELLCGRRPHRITSGSPQELEEAIVRRDPALPSVAMSRAAQVRSDGTTTEPPSDAIAADRRLSPDRLRRRLAGDLDAIVMMALRKESARRYSSADVLWEDIQRHLEGLPVLAHRGSRWYRARKFLARHRVEAVAATIVAVSLVGGATIALRQASVARRERDRAEEALAQSNEVTDVLVRQFRTPAPSGATREQVTAKDMLATGTARVEQLAFRPVVQAQMLDALGRVNDQIGRFADAEQMLRRALALRKQHLGENNLDVAATLNNLSNVLAQTNRAEEGGRLSRQALEIQRRVLGPNHPEVALTLAMLSRRTNSLASAESLLGAARDIQRIALGPRDLAVASTDLDLGGVYQAAGKLDKAEALYRESVAIREAIGGPDRGTIAVGMTVLAGLLAEKPDKRAEADSLYQRALGIMQQDNPPRLGRLVGPLSGLAHLAHLRGDHVRAESYSRQMLDAHERNLGRAHPITTEALEEIGEHLSAQGRHAVADSILTDALAVVERAVGSVHLRVGGMLTTRARVRLAAGRVSDAEVDLRRALASLDSADATPTEYTGATAVLLAQLVERQGKTDEATALYDRGSKILRANRRSGAYGVLAAYTAAGDHYRKLRRPEDEAYFRGLAR
jgi:serine/threonine-protein kinase